MNTRAIVAIAVPADVEVARAVLARGRRLADRLGIGWLAVLIQTPALRPRRMSPAHVQTIQRLFDLVLSLGGQLLCAEADDVATGLIELSRQENAEVLVLGASRRPSLLRRLIPGTTERVLRARRPFDVIVTREGADR